MNHRMRRWAARSAHRTAGRRCGHLAASSGTKSMQHGLQSSFSDCWLVHNDVISFCQPMRSSEIDSTSFCVSPFFGWQSWGSTAFCGTYRCQSNVFFFVFWFFLPLVMHHEQRGSVKGVDAFLRIAHWLFGDVILAWAPIDGHCIDSSPTQTSTLVSWDPGAEPKFAVRHRTKKNYFQVSFGFLPFRFFSLMVMLHFHVVYR